MKNDYLTVGKLLKVIKENNIPDDVSVCYHRIEDSYFEPSVWNGIGGPKNLDGWSTINVKGDRYYNVLEHNKKMQQGQLVIDGKLDKDEVGEYYWSDEYKDKRKFLDQNDETYLDQYIEAFCAYYNKEKNILCLTAHY